jgi:hypothetical protein
MFARAFDRANLLSRIHRFPENPVVRVYGSPTEMVAAATLLTFAGMTIEGPSAHGVVISHATFRYAPPRFG